MGSQLLIVAGRDRGRDMFATARGLSLAVEGCAPRELNRRVRGGDPPAAILLSAVDADPAIALAALRRTRVGASIPVIVFGPPGPQGPHEDNEAVFDMGGDAFLAEPVDPRALGETLSELLGEAEAQAPVSRPRGGEPTFAPPPKPPPPMPAMPLDRDPGPGGRRREEDDRDAVLRPLKARRPSGGASAGYLDGRSSRGHTAQERTEVIEADEETTVGNQRSERARSERETGESNVPMGSLHATLDRLEARLRTRDEPAVGANADQFGELDEFGLDEIPDVEPDGPPLDPRAAPVGPETGLDVAAEPDSYDEVSYDEDPYDEDPYDEEPYDEGAYDTGAGERGRDPDRGYDPPTPANSHRHDTLTDVAVLREAQRDSEGHRSEPLPRSQPQARASRAEVRDRYEGSERSGVLRPRRPPRSHAPDAQPRGQSPVSRSRASRPPRSVAAASPVTEQGRLDQRPLPELLWSLHERRYSGRVRVIRDRAQRDLWFLEGELVFIRSRLPSERLVDSLLRRGVLTRAQYETARRLAAKEPRRAGQLLMDAGFIKQRELERVVQDHLGRLVEACFGVESGTWALHPGERVDEEIVIQRSMRRTILDGVRNRLDRGALQHRLGTRVLRPRLVGLGNPNQRESVERLEQVLDLLPEEGDWVRAFDGKHGVGELLDLYDDELGLMALIYALFVTGVLTLLGEDANDSPARDPAQIDADRLAERLRLAREADYFVLLGVGRDASRAAVRSAFAQLRATFADENLEDETRERSGVELLELRAALEEARDILIDDAMRSAYLAHLDVDEQSA